MVSFYCETCCATLKKPKLDQHAQRCWAVFTCRFQMPGSCRLATTSREADAPPARLGRTGIDCSTTFQDTDYRSHTSCITEAEKYEKRYAHNGPAWVANRWP